MVLCVLADELAKSGVILAPKGANQITELFGHNLLDGGQP